MAVTLICHTKGNTELKKGLFSIMMTKSLNQYCIAEMQQNELLGRK